MPTTNATPPAVTRPPKPEIYQRADGQWSWRLRAANGEITACAGEGDGFASKHNAQRAWDDVVASILLLAGVDQPPDAP